MKKETRNGPSFRTLEVITLVLITCVVSLAMGYFIGQTTSENRYEPADSSLQNFIKQYNYIINNYYEELNKEELIESAIEGMINSLEDPYSMYMDENTSSKFNAELNGNYDGIGIEIINDSNNNIIVTRVFENSSAEESGIEVLDVIKSINGHNLDDITTSEFVEQVKNIKEKAFTLDLERDKKIITVSVSRKNVVLNSVTSKIFEQSGKKIGYLYLSIFANNTDSQFKTKLEELEKNKIDSLIIDLRGNSGGHLSSVENIMSVFLDKEKVIYQIEDKNKTTKYYSKGTKTYKYPMIVLMDNNSASASEMLAATLKESYGATLVGKTTYGKGTVQELQNTKNSQYKITTKKWLTPKGTWINEIGIKPDVEIDLDITYYNDPTDENDSQLQKALEILGK